MDHIYPLALDLPYFILIVLALTCYYRRRDEAFALQFFQQHFSLSLGWCFSVPLWVVCHVTYTVSFDRIGNYHHRLVMHLSSFVKSVHYLFDPVTIYLKDFPVKCTPLILYGIKWHNVFSKAVLLDPVTIQNGD